MLWSWSAVIKAFLSSHRMICAPVLQQEYCMSHIFSKFKSSPLLINSKTPWLLSGSLGMMTLLLLIAHVQVFLWWTEVQSQTCHTPTPVHIRKETRWNLQLVLSPQKLLLYSRIRRDISRRFWSVSSGCYWKETWGNLQLFCHVKSGGEFFF